jgi:hypothetical protein
LGEGDIDTCHLGNLELKIARGSASSAHDRSYSTQLLAAPDLLADCDAAEAAVENSSVLPDLAIRKL